MAPEKVKLSVERVREKIRYKRMVKGNLFKSKLYPIDSRRNRQEAWNEFCEWRDQQRQTEELGQEIRERNSELIAASLNSSLKETLLEQIELDRTLAAEMLQQSELLKAPTDESLRQILQRQQELQERIIPDHDLSAGKQAHRFTDLYRQKAETGELSVGRYGEVRTILARFVDWFGSLRSMSTISQTTVSVFYRYLLQGIKNGENRTTISTTWTLFKAFVEHCAEENEEVPLPANLRSKKYRITKERSEPDPFTIDEVKLFLEHATERTQLYLLLALNCGFYQGDLADLRADEVNWQEGRIVRVRSKLQSRGKGIQVNWLLWDRTFDLLKKHGNREGLVLLNERGEPLAKSGIKENGMEWAKNAVRSAHRRTVTKLKKRGLLPRDWHKTLKQLRKTGSNLIEKAKDHAEFYELYLDHSAVAKRHYLTNGESVPKFDEAIRWLGAQFGLRTSR